MLQNMQNVVRQAAKVFMEGALQSVPFSSKEGNNNFVTKYDSAIEAKIKGELQKLYPDIEFLGEEGSYQLQSDRYFVLDPIDGTANFIHHHRHSVISLAYCEKGEPILACVYNPQDEEMFCAQKGAGATLNGQPIHVSNRPLQHALVSFGTAPYYPELTKKSFALAQKLFDYCEDLRRLGAAALQLCYIAAGREDFFFEYILQPWDFSAGALIVTEAGGVAVTMENTPLPCDKPAGIIAGTRESCQEFFKQKFLENI